MGPPESPTATTTTPTSKHIQTLQQDLSAATSRREDLAQKVRSHLAHGKRLVDESADLYDDVSLFAWSYKRFASRTGRWDEDELPTELREPPQPLARPLDQGRSYYGSLERRVLFYFTSTARTDALEKTYDLLQDLLALPPISDSHRGFVTRWVDKYSCCYTELKCQSLVFYEDLTNAYDEWVAAELEIRQLKEKLERALELQVRELELEVERKWQREMQRLVVGVSSRELAEELETAIEDVFNHM